MKTRLKFSWCNQREVHSKTGLRIKLSKDHLVQPILGLWVVAERKRWWIQAAEIILLASDQDPPGILNVEEEVAGQTRTHWTIYPLRPWGRLDLGLG